MRQIYTIGESVLDIIFRNNVAFNSVPGGAMLNTAVSLGRLKLPVSFVGDMADDKVGDLLSNFLNLNNVQTNFTTIYKNSRSRIALAFLNENSDAEYTFYKFQKSDCNQIIYPQVNKNDIVIYGSYYAIKPENFDALYSFLKSAKKNGAILIYDPNFRKGHMHELDKLKINIEKHIEICDILKGSNDDFSLIFNAPNFSETLNLISKMQTGIFIYTENSKGVNIVLNNIPYHFDVPFITPISTIGAGDTFNAGMAFSIFKNNLNLNDLRNNIDVWQNIIQTSVKFSQSVCMSTENYLSHDFINKNNL